MIVNHTDAVMDDMQIGGVSDAARLMLDGLEPRVDALWGVVGSDAWTDARSDLRSSVEAPDAWTDANRPDTIRDAGMLGVLDGHVDAVGRLRAMLGDARDALGLADDDPAGMPAYAMEEARRLSTLLDREERALMLSGEYADRPAVVSIRAGAGGTEATDWARMLTRMYMAWADTHGMAVHVLETTWADAGRVRSATFRVDGPGAYGLLRAEAGTHRLSRISPFDNQSRRQTSFAAVEVTPWLDDGIPTLRDYVIPRDELRVDVYCASGPGGQGVNTTYSAVRMTHIPTGITVAVQDERDQQRNRDTAMRIMKTRLLILRREERDERRRELAGDVTGAWGDQIRSYTLTPYRLAKDKRTGTETTDTDGMLTGQLLDTFIRAELLRRAHDPMQVTGATGTTGGGHRDTPDRR